MRGLIGVAIAAMVGILAAFAGFVAQQFALVIDPATGPIARNCIGAAVFAMVLFACLTVARRQAQEN